MKIQHSFQTNASLFNSPPQHNFPYCGSGSRKNGLTARPTGKICQALKGTFVTIIVGRNKTNSVGRYATQNLSCSYPMIVTNFDRFYFSRSKDRHQ